MAKRPQRKLKPPFRHRVDFTAAVENVWLKYVTRVGMPILVSIAIYIGQRYWEGFLTEIKALHATDAAIREEVKEDRKQSAETNKEVVDTLNRIQQTVGQQQILIQQQYNELKDEEEEVGHRIEKLEDRFMDGNGDRR